VYLPLHVYCELSSTSGNCTVECLLSASGCFSGRRSLSCLALTDNAPNFQSAPKELKSFTSLPSHMNPLEPPGLGILGKANWDDPTGLIGKAFTKFHSLLTLIVEIDDIRPLTTVPTDINDPDPITPAHHEARSSSPSS